MEKHDIPSPRRAWLRQVIFLSVAVTALPKLALSDDKNKAVKASKAAVQYQDHA